MDSSPEAEFIVDEQYENEKGTFKVLSIEKDAMLIRWANGDEVQTSIKFQGRIQKRRLWEKALQEEKTAAAKPAPRKAKPSKPSKKSKPAAPPAE
jgi:hypothetical protein